MTAAPLVSIVTCSYNNADYILETLDSIKAQTYPNIELVIVDDCSTDNSVAIIENWLTTYAGKYTFIKHETNLAGSVPYNVGRRAATGKYYCAVDSDDALMPEKVARQVALLEAAGPDVAAVYSDAWLMDVNSERSGKRFIQRHRQFDVMPSGDIYAELLKGNFLPVLSLLIRGEVFDELDGYDESLVYGDFDMWLRIARKYRFLYSDYVSGKYRIRPGSLTYTIKNWDHTNALIMLKHVGGPLSADWINRIALHSYTTHNDVTMPLIRELAVHTHDRIMMATYLLWRFAVPPALGADLLQCVSAHIARGLSSQLLSPQASDLDIFLQEIAWSAPLSEYRQLADDAYANDRQATYPLLDGLGDKFHDRYLKAAALLMKFKAEPEKGAGLLARIGQNGGQAVPFQSTLAVLHDDVLPLVQPWWLRKVAASDYEADDTAAVLLINELAGKTGDRYLKAVYLFWRYKVLPATGLQALSELQDRIDGGVAATISDANADDSAVFMNEIAIHIPMHLMKQITSESYTGAGTISLATGMANSSDDGYFQAVRLLQSCRVPGPVGAAVLKCIDEGRESAPGLKLNSTTDARSFFRQIAPLLTTDLMRQIALGAYYANNKALWPVVKDFARVVPGRYFKAVLLLWRFNVNAYTGRIILGRVDAYTEAGRNGLFIDLCICKDIYGAYRSNNTTLSSEAPAMPGH